MAAHCTGGIRPIASGLSPRVASGRIASQRAAKWPDREGRMRKIGVLRCAVAVLAIVLAGPAAAETVKVGLILPYSGPFAGLGTVMDNAVKLWVAKNGDSVGAHKIEIIRRDEAGPNPDVSKRLAQE